MMNKDSIKYSIRIIVLTHIGCSMVNSLLEKIRISTSAYDANMINHVHNLSYDIVDSCVDCRFTIDDDINYMIEKMYE